MKITTIGVGKTRSVKIANYQYFKPQVYLEAQLEDDDLPVEVVPILHRSCDDYLDRIVADEHERFNRFVEVNELKEIMDENGPGSPEYRLAQSRLKDLGELI
jgi:hypothetical protein